MRNSMLLVLGACALLLFNGCGGKAGKDDEQVVARVGSRTVTVRQYRTALARRGLPARALQDPRVRREVLDEIVRFELMAESAEERGLFDDPDVRRAAEIFAVNRLQAELLAAASNRVAVTESEARAFYDQNPKEFEIPERVHVAVLHIALPADAPEAKRREALAKANKIRQEAAALPAATTHFGALSAKYSDDQATRYSGGDAGWLSRESGGKRWGPQVINVAFMLKNKGELSPVISSDEGLYILKLIERRESSQMPFERVAAGLRRKLQEDRSKQVIAEYVAGLEKKVSVKIDESLVAGN